MLDRIKSAYFEAQDALSGVEAQLIEANERVKTLHGRALHDKSVSDEALGVMLDAVPVLTKLRAQIGGIQSELKAKLGQ